jgi:hypothetical protein
MHQQDVLYFLRHHYQQEDFYYHLQFTMKVNYQIFFHFQYNHNYFNYSFLVHAIALLLNFMFYSFFDWNTEPNPIKKDESQNQKYVPNTAQKKNKT